MSTKRVEKWCEGKPLAFVTLALQIASVVEDLREMVNLVLTGDLFKKLPPAPKASEMLAMYRNHRKVADVISATLCATPGGLFGIQSAEDLRFGQEAIRAWDNLPPAEKEHQAKTFIEEHGIESVREIFYKGATAFERERRSVVAELAGEERTESLTDGDMGLPEIQFFFRVWLPCLFMHGEYATILLARARHGDQDALLKLLRIDKSILADPMIIEQVHEAYASGRFGAFDKFVAMIDARGKKVKMRAAKIQAAGMISLFAKGLKVKITVPEIQELFTAVAEAREKRPVGRDMHLPDDPASFARQVHMSREKLHLFPRVGKKSAAKSSG